MSIQEIEVEAEQFEQAMENAKKIQEVSDEFTRYGREIVKAYLLFKDGSKSEILSKFIVYGE